MGLGIAAAALMISAAPLASASSEPTTQGLSGSRTVTVDLTSLYINDDGDHGHPCGEGREWTDILDAVGVLGTIEPEHPPFLEEHWCSDTHYPLPTNNPGLHKVLYLQPGQTIYLAPGGYEDDQISSAFTAFSGQAAIQVPTKGHTLVKTVSAEGSNSHGHVRMTYTYKIITF